MTHTILRKYAWVTRTKLQLLVKPPVLIYQMGKVASTSIYEGIKATQKFAVFQVHRLNPLNILKTQESCVKRGTLPPYEDYRGIFLYHNLIKKAQPLKIISLAREPIARNISAYFNSLDSFNTTTYGIPNITTHQHISNFLNNYSHNVPLRWFDQELKITTNIDVFNQPFPKQVGYQVIESAPYHLLLMRHDLGDNIKEKLVSDFLCLPDFKLERKNIGFEKSYAEEYKTVLNSIKLPISYVDRMLYSKYTQHFYCDNEIQELKKRWTKQDL